MVLGRYTTNKGGNSSNTVLAARTSEACTNPNCKAKKRTTHTTPNCYWPGGGKEGQFPPGFGQQRAKANVTTSTPTTTMSNTPTTAAISTTTQTSNFVLTVRVPDPGQSRVLIDDPTDYPLWHSSVKDSRILERRFLPLWIQERAIQCSYPGMHLINIH